MPKRSRKSEQRPSDVNRLAKLAVDAANYPDDTASRYLLHIGATRAAHQLLLTACANPSPLIPPDVPVHLS